MASSRVNQTCISVRRSPWSIGGSPARQRPSGLVWSGIDNIVRGTETPPSWASSLSGKRDKGNVVTWQGLVASQEESRKRIGGQEAILSIECFNNVDVEASLWQSEPQDKSSHQEFASPHPSYLSFRISYYKLVCFYFF